MEAPPQDSAALPDLPGAVQIGTRASVLADSASHAEQLLGGMRSVEGLVAEERRVLTTVLSHRPGALAALTESLAAAEINIDGMYVLHSHDDEIELAIAVADEEAARAAIS